MNMPKISIQEIEDEKKRNFVSRLAFIDRYVKWLKKTPNAEWSKQQSDFINSQLRTSTMTKEQFLEMKGEL